MLSKNEVKYIQSLSHKKYREEYRAFIAEGPKLTAELLSSDFVIEHVYGTQEWLQHQSLSVPYTQVSEAELSRISNLSTAHEVLTVARQKAHKQEPLLSNAITIVLDGIQDPGNMGTIIRTADWFGIKQVVSSMDSVDVYNPKVVQSTMGSLCRVDVWYKDLDDWMAEVKVPVYGALLEGHNVYDLRKSNEGVLVIGNEAQGISESLRRRVTHAVTIPKLGGAESLNAAVATAIILGCMVNLR